ncbi:MAG TPA: hypothetical protein VEQ85_12595, partial [Lacipirellulaceae bacterium]|nr:hypothetical protein [Lacipirellulaceae bacterium]
MRRLSGRAVVAVLALGGGYMAARSLGLALPEGPAPAEPSGALAEPAAPNGGSREGDALVARVLATLESWPNVASQFRQLLRVGDAPLTGMGEYWQLGIGNQRKTCWQWQTMVG